MTKNIAMIVINLVTPKAAAKRVLVQQTSLWLVGQKLILRCILRHVATIGAVKLVTLGHAA